MASHAHPAAPLNETARVYSVCSFDRGSAVPQVKMFDAATDEEAILAARSMNLFKRRELWHRHRLIGVFAPESLS